MDADQEFSQRLDAWYTSDKSFHEVNTAGDIAEVLKISLPDLFDLPIPISRNREKSDLIKELVAISLDQDIPLLKAFLEHIRNLSEIHS